ncbi:MAG: hypothetical protein PVH61_42060 [Candidatus Aminicenantes bacterium]|jgi:hypothetical protein
MKKRIVLLFFIILALGFGCKHEQEKKESPITTDWCNDDTKANVDFLGYSSGSFNLYYLPGTAAERDREEILDKRNSALVYIIERLEIQEDRIIDIYMVPNRLCALAHHLRTGAAFPWKADIHVLYMDHPQTFERIHYGHEVTHVAAYNIDLDHLYHFRILEEGLAEFLDRSGRNYHQVFVQECFAHKLDLETAIQLNQDDVSCKSYAKAASFIQNLFEISPDADKFKAFYKGCYMFYSWDETPLGPDNQYLTVHKLIQLIDSQLKEHYGIALNQFNNQWLTKLTPLAANGPIYLPADDIAEIQQLFAIRDQAISEGSPELYRSTMEGFYCDLLTDSERMAIAIHATSGLPPVKSNLIEVFDLGIRNFPYALAYFEKNVNGNIETYNAYLERYDVGWRFIYVEDEPGRGDGQSILTRRR